MKTLVEQHLETQRITSAGTSVNQLPAVLRLLDALYKSDLDKAMFWSGIDPVLDYGGGKYDKLTDALIARRVRNLVYDPFNRTEEHNNLVLNLLRAKKADMGICSNVLNVIREPAARLETLEHLQIGVKEGGSIFITIHEGNESSKGRRTSRGWQSNRPAKNYMREIRRVFPNSFGTRWGSKALIIIENWPTKIHGWPRIREN